ncbi:GNAT family N-acetyltransferase [Streptomyces syringium]|uniref:GNAT family N-acetyltransferase n=1 Tax=Streptomyces syringium TaxID=76729 RepID=UPI0037D3B552
MYSPRVAFGPLREPTSATGRCSHHAGGRGPGRPRRRPVGGPPARPRTSAGRAGSPRRHAWVGFISVAERHRRAGAGRALTSEFARRAQKNGATGIGLLAEYADDRDGRIAFFSSCGFTEAWPGTVRDIYVASPDAVLAACGRRRERPSPGSGTT